MIDFEENSHIRNTHIESFVELLKERKYSKKNRIIIFAGAAISMAGPAHLPDENLLLTSTISTLLDDPQLRVTLSNHSLLTETRERLENAVASRILPPETFYDALYEFSGDRALKALNCLKIREQNNNHHILAKLLSEQYIDSIVTTNFDNCIEASQFFKKPRYQWRRRKRVWKIHGSINSPEEMVTIFRRVGRRTFDEKMSDNLKSKLRNSHVLFIGYGGVDPDIIPVLRAAGMLSVYWNVLHADECKLKINSEPLKTISKATPINWIVGDLNTCVLRPIAKQLDFEKGLLTSATIDRERMRSRLKTNLAEWDSDTLVRLTFKEKARAILLMLYNIGTALPKSSDVWELIVKLADAFESTISLDEDDKTQTWRDIILFRAEAYLYLGKPSEAKNDLEKVEHLPIIDAVQVQVLITMGAVLFGLPGPHNFYGACQCFEDALTICKQLQDYENRSRLNALCWHNVAQLFVKSEQFVEAYKYLGKAEKLAKQCGDLYSYISICLTRLELSVELGLAKDTRDYCLKVRSRLIEYPHAELQKRFEAIIQYNSAELSGEG